MPTYANELDYADSEPANQICGQTTVGKVHAISKSAPAISNCHQNLFVSTNEEGALAPQMFGPLCLVFAGKRAIGWAMCYGKCGPNLLLQPLVEGCQAGQGETSPSHAGAVPACTAALLFHAAGAASSACSNSVMPSGLWGARCLQSSLQMCTCWVVFGSLALWRRQNGGWMPSLCLLLLVVWTWHPGGAAFPFPLS